MKGDYKASFPALQHSPPSSAPLSTFAAPVLLHGTALYLSLSHPSCSTVFSRVIWEEGRWQSAVSLVEMARKALQLGMKRTHYFNLKSFSKHISFSTILPRKKRLTLSCAHMLALNDFYFPSVLIQNPTSFHKSVPLKRFKPLGFSAAGLGNKKREREGFVEFWWQKHGVPTLLLIDWHEEHKEPECTSHTCLIWTGDLGVHLQRNSLTYLLWASHFPLLKMLHFSMR